jgi:hypothetical protein
MRLGVRESILLYKKIPVEQIAGMAKQDFFGQTQIKFENI